MSLKMQEPNKHKTWTRQSYLISTDNSLLSIPAINDAFAQDFMYWTNPLPEEVLEELLNSSLCFGLYDNGSLPDQEPGPTCSSRDDNGDDLPPRAKQQPKQIGLARLITDRVTFAYLTDVYVLPSHRDLGLGGWLLDCVNEYLDELPYLRWSMLRTSRMRSKEAYERRLGMGILENGPIGDGEEEGGPWMMGKKGRGCLA